MTTSPKYTELEKPEIYEAYRLMADECKKRGQANEDLQQEITSLNEALEDKDRTIDALVDKAQKHIDTIKILRAERYGYQRHINSLLDKIAKV